MIDKIIIDAKESPLGRVASYAAKKALLGNSVFIVNCDYAVISGRKKDIIARYREYRIRGGSSLNGPHFPKSPERIMKRTVRGMVGYTKGRGSVAIKKVICYNGVPDEYSNMEKVSVSKVFKISTMRLKELAGLL